MSDDLNPKIVAANQFLAHNVTHLDVAQDQGSGMAYQVVSQAVAAAVMDATDYLRSMNALNVATISASTARMVESGKADEWKEVLHLAQKNSADAAKLFEAVGCSAARILQQFQDPTSATSCLDSLQGGSSSSGGSTTDPDA